MKIHIFKDVVFQCMCVMYISCTYLFLYCMYVHILHPIKNQTMIIFASLTLRQT